MRRFLVHGFSLRIEKPLISSQRDAVGIHLKEDKVRSSNSTDRPTDIEPLKRISVLLF